jgi:hypothetical protein
MRARVIEDAVHRGMGRAGVVAGAWCEVFRPDGPVRPMAGARLVLRMPAVFAAPDAGFARVPAAGRVFWHGAFDAAYTRVGDYVRRGDGAVWFIAEQAPLMPVLCVRATRVIDLFRAAVPEAPGIAPYGGGGARQAVLEAWPAGVVDGALLLPATIGAVPRAGDEAVDDLGQRSTVARVELSPFGWRLALATRE